MRRAPMSAPLCSGPAGGQCTVRRSLLVLVTVLALLATGVAAAQFGRRFMRQIHDNAAPPTEFVGMRWHFGTNGAIGHMGWSHNYPESEINLNEFIGRNTRVDVEDNSYRLIEDRKSTRLNSSH